MTAAEGFAPLPWQHKAAPAPQLCFVGAQVGALLPLQGQINSFSCSASAES